jgi:tyrosyl-tRNA synthetase
MKFADVLELASQMTVDQMLKRDMFAKRIAEEKLMSLELSKCSKYLVAKSLRAFSFLAVNKRISGLF